jgi:hypothetical protein
VRTPNDRILLYSNLFTVNNKLIFPVKQADHDGLQYLTCFTVNNGNPTAQLSGDGLAENEAEYRSAYANGAVMLV